MAMEEEETEAEVVGGSPEEWLARAQHLLPAALAKAVASRGFVGRWKSIASKLERLPRCLSDLSSHPCFARHALCRDLLCSVAATLSEAVCLADRCGGGSGDVGKLQMQSDLDALSGKLDLVLRDCALLVKTGVLGESASAATTAPVPAGARADSESADGTLRELFARLQIGHAEAKHQALDGLLEAMREDEKGVVAALGRSSVSALVHLLAAAAPPRVREKAATAVCLLAESGSCEGLMVAEGVLPPLIRLLDSGSLVGREKAAITLQRLSMSVDTALSIAGHGGIRPLAEVCQDGDSICQLAAAGALKNLSAVPELRQNLEDEGAVRVMIGLLDCGTSLESKEYAAECLQNLTSSNDSLRRSVLSEGGIRSLLAYLEGPLPQEPAVGALSNLVAAASMESLITLGLVPRLVLVLKDGPLGAQQAAATAVCRISNSEEMKKLAGEFGCVPPLVKMLEAKTNAAREVAAQAVACLMSCPRIAREVKKDEKSVPNLVQLLDPNPQNTAKKYAVVCLLRLSSSKKSKRMMISYGAIGYLKKLSDMDVPGAKKLLRRLERGDLRSLFSRK